MPILERRSERKRLRFQFLDQACTGCGNLLAPGVYILQSNFFFLLLLKVPAALHQAVLTYDFQRSWGSACDVVPCTREATARTTPADEHVVQR